MFSNKTTHLILSVQLRCSEVRLQLPSATYVRCPAVEATPNGVSMADGHLGVGIKYE